MRIVMIGTVASCVFGFRLSLIKDLISKGHEVYTFATDFSEQQKHILNSLGVVAIDYKITRSGLNIFSDIKMMLELKNNLKKIQPDIVLSYFVKPVIFGTFAAALAKIPIRIAMLEGLGHTYTKDINGFTIKKRVLQLALGCLFSLSFKFATKIIFLNSDDPNDLSKTTLFSKKKIEVLGGIGIDLSDYPYSKPNLDSPMRFIFVARLLIEKGVYQLIDAIKLVRKKYDFVELVILGGIDEENPASLSEEEVNNLSRQEIITYPGEVNNVSKWLKDSHVFVLPSFREGLPRSTQEAMAIGRPILTTDVPGCRETVEDGENGFLVSVFDVENLAAKMIWFIEHPDKIEKMGIISRQMAEENFDSIKVNAKMCEFMGV